MSTSLQNEDRLGYLLEQAVEEALMMRMSDSRLMQKLLELYSAKSDTCRSVVHINGYCEKEDKLFDPVASPRKGNHVLDSRNKAI